MPFLRDLLSREQQQNVENVVEQKETKYVGKISKVDKTEDKGGWGFISSKEIEFTRIFFHWTGLVQDTLNFKKLEKGMKVEFVAREQPGRGWQAFKIKVIE
jgi:cold shock CspA family protein